MFGCTSQVDIEQIAKDDKLNSQQKNYLEGCEKYDNIKACDKIAWSYEYELENDDKALKYYEKSCNLAAEQKILSKACDNAVDLYEEKLEAGIKGSKDKALRYYELTCRTADWGRVSACEDAAEIFIEKKDYQKAKRYALMSALYGGGYIDFIKKYKLIKR
ncbi:hypothetical protein [Campylobacter sp. MIT 12-5580]|uniref:hypothetical protein n=1 Tax=Campylobacter sp. MIT 12-5580 TaxID=2040651 RepID=UPI0010F4967B|nr:hypothetical protein [Campylobacter sp. MIT 12-5580]